MTNCPSCTHKIEKDALKCPSCGLSFDETSGATAFLPPANESPPIHSTESADGARFAAGTILAERYRIVSLLGRGGMGEVYKAEDLKLKQIVALKFLPDALTLDGAALNRFHNEVRITRQISHPNVCRVYDIAEADGLHFLSMEFIDGEDLSHLLRRIGRLPGDKATEIARQICAGLAAAHDNNVLHRDLKPANIMIDGRGKARVTDFGVAVVAKELLGREAASGTPAYMAPEQLKGEKVTQRSDIYSLGLVLYELFTGKPVYDSDNLHDLMKMHESSTPTSPSSHVEHIDPLVERVIMRCLEKVPGKRPAAAIQVAAALPGGDPLAAALAAGETPSPEMVAASGEKTGLRPTIALALMAAIVAVLAFNFAVGRKVDRPARLMRENSPDALTHKAQDIVGRLGYSDKPADSASGLTLDRDHLQDIDQNSTDKSRSSRYDTDEPAILYFWYRQSPRPLEPGLPASFGGIAENDPPNGDVSGMVSLRLDPAGRMTYFKSVPPQFENPMDNPPPSDWLPLFAAAGLDQTAFAPTQSTWLPESSFDSRAAWTGAYPDQPDVPIRIEAAAYKGKPTYFNLIAPWQRSTMMQEFQPSTGQVITGYLALLLLVFIPLLGALLLVRINLRKGRGDRRGAARLSLFILGVSGLGWIFGADHHASVGEIASFAILSLSQSLFVAGLIWLLYITLEPYVRRRWPETIVSWSRVLAGKLLDPLVGKDVLVGLLVGLTFIMFGMIQKLILVSMGATPPPDATPISSWLGPRQLIAVGILGNLIIAIFNGLFLFFMVFLVRLIARRQWSTAIIFPLVFCLLNIGQADPLIAVSFAALASILIAFLCLRFGLLSLTVAMFVSTLPITQNFSAWYTSSMIAMFVLVLTLAGWAFHTSLGGQKVITGTLLEE